MQLSPRIWDRWFQVGLALVAQHLSLGVCFSLSTSAPCFAQHWCHGFTVGEKEGPRRSKFAISEKEILFLLLESTEIPLNGIMTGRPWSYGQYCGWESVS